MILLSFLEVERCTVRRDEMGKAVQDKQSQISYLKNRLQLLSASLDSMDPDTADPEQMKQFLSLLEQLQMKAKQYKKDWQREGESN